MNKVKEYENNVLEKFINPLTFGEKEAKKNRGKEFTVTQSEKENEKNSEHWEQQRDSMIEDEVDNLLMN